MKLLFLRETNQSSDKRDFIFFVAFILIYLGNLFTGLHFQIKETGEILPLIVIFGLIFTSIALISSKNYPVTTSIKSLQATEPLVLTGFIIYIIGVIIIGNGLYLGSSFEAKTGEIITLVRKVITFFVIPFLVYKVLYGFSLKDFGLHLKWRKVVNRKSVTIWLLFSSLLLLLNYFAGSGALPLRQGTFTTAQIMKAVPLFAIWLFIEVGLVEEFFFRGLLQNRLSVLLRSNTGAILISAIIFGLVHAPGMYLRQAGINDGLGSEPTLINSIVYCIAVQSIPGLFLGILWARTRNLWLLMGIHAMFDLLPGLPDFITTWGIN